MTLSDILESAKETLLERLASPIISGFVVSWCLWNWKFLVILFSDTTVSQTFLLIEQIVFPDIQHILINGIIYPLLTTSAYIFVYPYPALFVYAFSLRRQRETNEIKRQITNETLLTQEESRSLRSEFLERERRNVEYIGSLNEEVTRLKGELDTLLNADNDLSPAADKKIYDKLSISQLALLNAIEKNGGRMLESELIKRSEQAKVRTEFDIGELVKSRLVDRNYDLGKNGYALTFTHEGRRVVLQSSDDPRLKT